jgi:hypothetical protein
MSPSAEIPSLDDYPVYKCTSEHICCFGIFLRKDPVG